MNENKLIQIFTVFLFCYSKQHQHEVWGKEHNNIQHG
jgi:hypothetical protein